MEDQAEYKTKNRPFHGDYTSPRQARLDESVGQARLDESVGQGKRPEQYESSAIMLGYTFGFIIVLIVVFGCYKLVECIINFLKNWL